MTVSRGNYNIFVQMTPCRVVATANQAGTYFNGPSNNGVKATLTVSSLTIDSVALVQGDSVLLMAQTNGNENGIYFVADEDAMILQRRNDFQSAEQIQPGAFIPISAGTLNAGSMFMVVEPLPVIFGVDDLVITASPLNSGLGTAATKAASDNTKAVVSSVGSAVQVGYLAHFVDVAGTIDDTAGAVINAGSIQSGLSGTAGSFIGYPPTAANGFLQILPVNAGGAFNSIISNGTMGQTSTYTLPDPANAAARFLVGATATPFISGNFPVASGTGGLMVDSGVAAADLQLNTNIIAATTADIGGGGVGPISVVVAGATANSVVVATVESSSNPVSVVACTATATGFDITFSADPGAACLVNYILFIAAQ